MNSKPITFIELFEKPEMAAHVTSDEFEKIAISLSLSEVERSQKDPIYILALSGLGAWFSAIFVLIFIGISGIFNDSGTAIFLGVIFLISAIAISKINQINFLNQLTLAFAIAGNSLINFGVVDKHESGSLLITHTIVCAIVYPFFDNRVYRFIAPIGIIIAATILVTTNESTSFLHLIVAIIMISFGYLLFNKRRPLALNPLFYSTATMLPALLLTMNFSQINWWFHSINEPLWPSSIILAAGLIYLIIHLAGAKEKVKEPWLILAIVSIGLLGVFTTPGLLVAVGLLIAGRAFDDKFLTVLAYIFLPCFLVVFYYALNIDLGSKSFVIAGTGVLLILIRWLTTRCQPKENLA